MTPYSEVPFTIRPARVDDAEAIYLRKAFHGTGIGRALFERSLRALAQRGFSKAAVWVLAANPTRTFYEAAGGRLVSSLAGSKEIEVGGVMLSEVSYEWDLIRNL